MTDTAKDLASALVFRDAALRVLPVDAEAERLANAALADYHRRQGPGRKITKRSP